MSIKMLLFEDGDGFFHFCEMYLNPIQLTLEEVCRVLGLLGAYPDIFF